MYKGVAKNNEAIAISHSIGACDSKIYQRNVNNNAKVTRIFAIAMIDSVENNEAIA
jgi:triacylglycerol esterase/lipase EstA (alpha/beta hydrolase family)